MEPTAAPPEHASSPPAEVSKKLTQLFDYTSQLEQQLRDEKQWSTTLSTNLKMAAEKIVELENEKEEWKLKGCNVAEVDKETKKEDTHNGNDNVNGAFVTNKTNNNISEDSKIGNQLESSIGENASQQRELNKERSFTLTSTNVEVSKNCTRHPPPQTQAATIGSINHLGDSHRLSDNVNLFVSHPELSTIRNIHFALSNSDSDHSDDDNHEITYVKTSALEKDHLKGISTGCLDSSLMATLSTATDQTNATVDDAKNRDEPLISLCDLPPTNRGANDLEMGHTSTSALDLEKNPPQGILRSKQQRAVFGGRKSVNFGSDIYNDHNDHNNDFDDVESAFQLSKSEFSFNSENDSVKNSVQNVGNQTPRMKPMAQIDSRNTMRVTLDDSLLDTFHDEEFTQKNRVDR